LSILFIFDLSFGQDKDSVKVKESIDFTPSYIIAGYNAVPLINSVFFESKTAQEVQLGIDFANYLFMVDYGLQKTSRGDSSYHYENRGSHFKVGIEANVLKNASFGNSLTLGLRYAMSRFKDEINFERNYGFGSTAFDRSNSQAKSRWFELTLGLNVKVAKPIYFGYTVRYKVFRKNSGIEGLEPYDIPGFGRNSNQSTVGFDYYIRWIIPLKKEEEVPEESN